MFTDLLYIDFGRAKKARSEAVKNRTRWLLAVIDGKGGK
jgi:hypothetical protein